MVGCHECNSRSWDRARSVLTHPAYSRVHRRLHHALNMVRCWKPQKRGIIMNNTNHRIYTTSVASVYPHYVAKAEKKGRTKAEVDDIIRWLTGYSEEELEAQLEKQ